MSQAVDPRLALQALRSISSQASASCTSFKSSSLSRGHSIGWDGDTFELPREMIWNLPAQYLVDSYADAHTPSYESEHELKGEMQEEVDDVLLRMEDGYASSQGSWASYQSQPKDQPASQLSFTQTSVVLSPLMTHTSTLHGFPPSPLDPIIRQNLIYNEVDESQPGTPRTAALVQCIGDGAHEAESSRIETLEPPGREESESTRSPSKLLLTLDDTNIPLLDLDLDTEKSPPALDDPSPLDDISPPSGGIVTPPLLDCPSASDDALLGHYNGKLDIATYEATEVDPEEANDVDSVGLTGLPALAGLYASSEMTIDVHSEDGEYELVNDDLTHLEATPASPPSPRLDVVDETLGKQSNPLPFDDIQVDQHNDVQLPPTPLSPSFPPPKNASSSPIGTPSTPTPAPRTKPNNAMERCKREIYLRQCKQQGKWPPSATILLIRADEHGQDGAQSLTPAKFEEDEPDRTITLSTKIEKFQVCDKDDVTSWSCLEAVADEEEMMLLKGITPLPEQDYTESKELKQEMLEAELSPDDDGLTWMPSKGWRHEVIALYKNQKSVMCRARLAGREKGGRVIRELGGKSGKSETEDYCMVELPTRKESSEENGSDPIGDKLISQDTVDTLSYSTESVTTRSSTRALSPSNIDIGTQTNQPKRSSKANSKFEPLRPRSSVNVEQLSISASPTTKGWQLPLSRTASIQPGQAIFTPPTPSPTFTRAFRESTLPFVPAEIDFPVSGREATPTKMVRSRTAAPYKKRKSPPEDHLEFASDDEYKPGQKVQKALTTRSKTAESAKKPRRELKKKVQPTESPIYRSDQGESDDDDPIALMNFDGVVAEQATQEASRVRYSKNNEERNWTPKEDTIIKRFWDGRTIFDRDSREKCREEILKQTGHDRTDGALKFRTGPGGPLGRVYRAQCAGIAN